MRHIYAAGIQRHVAVARQYAITLRAQLLLSYHTLIFTIRHCLRHYIWRCCRSWLAYMPRCRYTPLSCLIIIIDAIRHYRSAAFACLLLTRIRLMLSLFAMIDALMLLLRRYAIFCHDAICRHAVTNSTPYAAAFTCCYR